MRVRLGTRLTTITSALVVTITVATHVVSLPTGVGPSDGYDPSGAPSEIRTARW